MRRTNAEAETPVLRYLMWRTDSFEKTLMLGKIVISSSRGSFWQDGCQSQHDKEKATHFLDPPELKGHHAERNVFQLDSDLGETQVKQFWFLVLLNLCLREHSPLWEHVWVPSFSWYFISLFLSYLYREKRSYRIKFKCISFSSHILVVPLILPQNLATPSPIILEVFSPWGPLFRLHFSFWNHSFVSWHVTSFSTMNGFGLVSVYLLSIY